MVSATPPSPHWPLVVVALLMVGLLGAGVAFYFATQVDRRWIKGDTHGAANASRLAKIWAVSAITFGALILVAAVAISR
jgi:hypothetical protein